MQHALARRKQAARTFRHRLQRLIVGEHGKDDPRFGRIGWAAGTPRAACDQRRHLVGIAVPHRHRMPRIQQAPGHPGPHLADAHEPDIHKASP